MLKKSKPEPSGQTRDRGFVWKRREVEGSSNEELLRGHGLERRWYVECCYVSRTNGHGDVMETDELGADSTKPISHAPNTQSPLEADVSKPSQTVIVRTAADSPQPDIFVVDVNDSRHTSLFRFQVCLPVHALILPGLYSYVSVNPACTFAGNQ